ncbi:MAG: hypothetical protein Q8929_12195 [Bacillota bacterium]|nr:hypothetical protein [Bacillota bacterium]
MLVIIIVVRNDPSKEIINMKKITAVALVLGVLVLAGFSVDNQSPKKASQPVSAANDYASFTQYMQ